MIDRLRFDAAANELSRRIEGRIQSDFRAFELGTTFGDGRSGQGGRP